MRHRRRRGKLGVHSTQHRKALLRSLVCNLVTRRRIRTTLVKAKVVRSFADQMVELAKRGDLHARRLLIAKLGCPKTANTLIKDIAPHFKERQGGYTRVLHLGFRPGDGADMALLEFTAAVQLPEKPKKVKKEKKAKEIKHEETPKPKKEKEKKTAAEKPSEEKAGEKETQKKGGFLGKLRRFLKGDEEQH